MLRGVLPFQAEPSRRQKRPSLVQVWIYLFFIYQSIIYYIIYLSYLSIKRLRFRPRFSFLCRLIAVSHYNNLKQPIQDVSVPHYSGLTGHVSTVQTYLQHEWRGTGSLKGHKKRTAKYPCLIVYTSYLLYMVLNSALYSCVYFHFIVKY